MQPRRPRHRLISFVIQLVVDHGDQPRCDIRLDGRFVAHPSTLEQAQQCVRHFLTRYAVTDEFVAGAVRFVTDHSGQKGRSLYVVPVLSLGAIKS